MARPRKAPPEPTPPAFDPAALDALLGDARTAEDVDALFRQMKKALMERILSAELTHHLGYGPGEPKPATQPNHRNGTTPKTVVTEDGTLPLAIPRDRAGTFAPQLVPKGVRRLPRFDQNVLSLYARGMSVREIRAHLEDLYQVEVAPDLISTVTDEVLEEITAWQQRPLDACYPVVFFDALRVKIRDEGVVRTKAVYLALGITRSGTKDVLGLWIEQTEGAKFWHRVMTELQARGVADVLIALIDGLTGFPEAIQAVFPQTQIHTCVVHLVRRSLAYVSYQHRKRVAAALKTIYRAETVAAGAAALAAFAASPDGARYRRSPRSGSASGIWSHRPSPTRPRSGRFSRPRTRSRACTCNSGRSSRPGGTSRRMRPRPNCSISPCATSRSAGPRRRRGRPR